MDFSLREFIKSGLLLAIGHKADYEVILAAGDWLKIGVLNEEDLAEIQTAIDEKNAVNNAEITERGAEYGY